MDLNEKQIKYFWDRIEKGDGCWNWKKGLSTDGYGTLAINDGKTIKASRLALLLSKPNPDNKPYALHICKQNRKCCNPDHLYWGNQFDNMKDREKDKTYIQKGENNPFSKLNNEIVLKIREKYETGNYSYTKLGSEYNISKSSIAKIIKKESWGHI